MHERNDPRLSVIAPENAPSWTTQSGRRYVVALWGAYFLALQSLSLVLLQNDSNLKVNLILQMTTLMVFAWFSRKASGTYLNAPFIFAVSIFIWHSTFFVGYFFNLALIFGSPGGAFDIGFAYIYKSTALVGLSLALSMVGMIWGYERQLRESQARRLANRLWRVCYSAIDSDSKRVPWYLFAAMTSILAMFMIREGASVFDRRYLDLYAYAPTSLSAILFFRSQYFWVFVIVLLFACYRDNRRIVTLIAILTIVLCGLLAMLGPRSGPFVCLVALLLSWDCFVRRVRLYWIAAFVLFLSAASFVIASGREAGLGTHVFDFANTGREKLDLLDLFYEQGRSVTVVLRTMDLTARTGFVYGRTILDSTVSVIPLPILELTGYRYAKPLGDTIVDNSPDMPLASGWGSSLIAELYYNFGMFGSLVFLVIGWFIGRAYFDFIASGNIYSGLGVMTVVSMYTMMMRNDSGSCWRLLIYAFLVVALLRSRRENSFVKHELIRVRKLRDDLLRRGSNSSLGSSPSSSPA
jgi:hypothetical protein